MKESISRLPFPWWFLDVEQGTSKSTLQVIPSQARRVKTGLVTMSPKEKNMAASQAAWLNLERKDLEIVLV